MKYYLNGISGITYRAKACMRMSVRERESRNGVEPPGTSTRDFH
jgi:hypothetical protein